MCRPYLTRSSLPFPLPLWERVDARRQARSRVRGTAGLAPSHHHHDRIFDQHLEGADQLGAERAVDGAVIAGQRDAHYVRRFDLAIPDYRALFAGADREDAGMRRVDDSGEMIDAVHAEVGDGGGAALIFLGL